MDEGRSAPPAGDDPGPPPPGADRFRQVFDAGPVPAAISTLSEGRIVAANRALARLLGWEQEELVGRTAAELGLWAAPERRRAMLDRALGDGHLHHFQETLRARSGETLEVLGSLEVAELGGERCLISMFHDVSRRVRAERALAESEARLRGIVENAPLILVVTDVEGRVTLATREAVRAFGDELVGRAPEELLDPERAARWRAVDRRLLAGSGPIHGEGELPVGADGARRVYSTTRFALPAASGEPAGFGLIGVDVTERRRAQVALEAAEERYRALFEDAPVGMFLTRPGGEPLAVNRAGAALFGYDTPERFLAEVPSTGALYRDPAEREPMMAALRERDRLSGWELAMLRRDGTPVWVTTDIRALRGGDGEIAALYGSMVDITARRQAQDALRASEERFRLLVDSARDHAIITLDPEGRVTGWNPGAERISGYAAAEIIGRHFSVFYPPELLATEHPRRELEAALAEGSYREEGQRVRKDGSRFWAEVTLGPIRDDAGELRGFVKITRDISERRAAEATLARARDAALEASRMKSEFLARMSHEIRTPMNGVIGMASLLLESRLDAEQREFARTVRSSAEALRAVIDDILDFSKIEAGRLEIERTSFDLAELVEEVCRLLAGAAHAKGIELVASIDLAGADAVLGDPVRVRQVLTNLVGNAVKFTDHGQVVVTASAPAVTGQELRARLEVRDTGIGIPEEARERLFESFSQADASTTRRFGGTGLGLTISARLVEMMGGEIGFDSRPGAGSTFWFELPLPRDEGPAPPRPGRLRDRRVLVVDDLEINRAVLTRQLAGWGMRTASAGDAEEALAAVRAASAAGEPFEVVVTDLEMPGMDGLSLAGALMGQDASPPVIVLSSGGGRESVRDRLTANVSAFIVKPPRRSQLQDALVAALLAGAVAAPAIPAAPAPPAPAAPDPPATPAPPGRRGTVLVVDDFVVNREVACAMVALAGFAAEEASDGEEAVAALERRRFDVVLMDCEMPVLDGYGAAAEIRRREGDGPRTPIIALTASALKGDAERALAAGMDLHLPKPIDFEQLGAALDAVLARAPAGGSAPPPAPGLSGAPASPPPGPAGPLDPVRVAELRRSGAAGALRELAELFAQGARSRLEELRVAARSGDAEAVRRAAHAFRGAGANAGAHRLVALLDDIEALARQGGVPDAGLLARLDEARRDAEAALARELG